jgi:rod shape-determining protein MreB
MRISPLPALIPDMAFDMGTANVAMYVKDKGLIKLREAVPDLVESEKERKARTVPKLSAEDLQCQIRSIATRDATGEIDSIGDEAYNKIGRVPENRVARPVMLGRIYDSEAFLKIMEKLIYQEVPNFKSLRYISTAPLIVVGVPCNTTLNERRAVETIIKHELKANPVLISEPVAAAIGAKLEFLDAKACSIIDIGGGTTDFSVLTSGAVLTNYTNSFEFGGDLMDKEIIDFVKETHQIQIGPRTAEWVKKKIGSAAKFRNNAKLTAIVKGRPLESNPEKKREITLTSDEIRGCLMPVFAKIADTLDFHIHQIQEGQVHSDMQETGIWLTGGGSMVEGMDKYLTERLGFKINRVEKPLLSVINGAAAILNDPELMKLYRLPNAA